MAPRSSAPHWCRQATWHRDKKSLCRWTWSCTRESVRCSGDFGFNAEVYPSQLEVTLVKSSFLLFAPYTKAVAANRQAQEETATTVNKREEFDLRSLLLASRDEDTETIPTLQSVRAGPSDSDIQESSKARAPRVKYRVAGDRLQAVTGGRGNAEVVSTAAAKTCGPRGLPKRGLPGTAGVTVTARARAAAASLSKSAGNYVIIICNYSDSLKPRKLFDYYLPIISLLLVII